ncbi:MAG: hypothetical protein ACJ8DI_17410 [Ktedonobacteraceae bacterium]
MNISEWNQQQTTIGHLKLRCTGSQEDINRIVLRLRVERLLSNADLHPPGLGTGAILIVRKLDSPAPVELSMPLQSVQASWHELLRSQVAALYAAAARPALDAVPLDASSVLFADPGEMLACLTRDLLNGQAGEHWYWQQVLRNAPSTPGTALPALWCEQANYVPAVFASLWPGELVRVLRQLSLVSIRQLIHALHASFELSPVALTLMASGELEGRQGASAIEKQAGEKQQDISSQDAMPHQPWERWLPNTQSTELAPEVRYLLGLGLALYHAPAFARSTRFAAQAVQWLQGLQAVRERQIYEPDRSRHPGKKAGEEITLPEQDDAQIVPLAREGEQRRTQVEDSTARDRVNREALLPVGEEQLPVASARSNDDMPPAAKLEPSSSPAGPDERSGEPVSAQSHGPAISAEQELVQLGSRGPEASVPTELEAGVSTALAEVFHEVQPPGSQAPMQLAVSAVSDEMKTREFEFGGSKALSTDGVATRLGGVLYLINLLTWLNLPHSWDDDGRFAQQMSGWAIVEALARGLLGGLYEQYRHDPIWEALALLDRREPGQSIAVSGMALEEERPFRLPASWLRRFGAVVWSAFQQDERLLLYDDAAGFLVADVPLRGRTFFEAAHAEVAAYSDMGLDVSWHIGNPVRTPFMASGWAAFTTPTGEWEKNWLSAYMSEEVLWWLGRVMGFVYCVLERALGERFDDATRLAELVLCRHGQLVVGRTHVDLYMSMEEISIAVRCAGLDRDPGWVPDLARIVYLHFE